jgi:hypothetical protein
MLAESSIENQLVGPEYRSTGTYLLSNEKEATVLVEGNFTMEGGSIKGNRQWHDNYIGVWPSVAGQYYKNLTVGHLATAGVRLVKKNATDSVSFTMSGGIINNNEGGMGPNGQLIMSGDVLLDSSNGEVQMTMSGTAGIGALAVTAIQKGGVIYRSKVQYNEGNIDALMLYGAGPVQDSTTMASVITLWQNQYPLTSGLKDSSKLGNFVAGNGAYQAVSNTHYITTTGQLVMKPR